MELTPRTPVARSLSPLATLAPGLTLGLALLLALVLAAPAAAGTDLGHLGTFARWSKVEIVLPGPASSGTGTSPNPFAIDVTATFTGPGGSFTVPAFYDGDGAGGADGNVWKVRFAPNAAGAWSLASASPVALLDNYRGTFDVVEVAGCSAYVPGGLPDFACVGRLEWVGGHHLKFASGPFWVKGGQDDPEDFLAPGITAGFASKEAFIDYLAGKSINSLYVMTNNVGGDANNVSPWTIDTQHFDVAKLAGWEQIFDSLQSHGLVIHLVLEDDSGSTNFDRPLYYRTIVARFGHYNGLIWNLSEEYNENYSSDQIKSFAQMLSDLDPYGHPLTVHHQGDTSRWLPFVGDPRFDLTSLHSFATPQNAETLAWRQRTEDAGRPIAISFDEAGDRTASRDAVRHIVWSIYTAGGYFELHTSPLSDLRTYAAHLDDLTRARTVLEELPFWQMAPANALLTAGTGYVYARAGSAYLVYLPSGGAATLDLTADPQLFDAAWVDPRDGSRQVLAPVAGGAPVPFTPPASGDWALVLERRATGANVPPTAFDQEVATPRDTAIAVTLDFDDPDGPGPYTFTPISLPTSGTLSDDDGDALLVYTPDPGFTGSDAFTWRVSDGLDPSNEATVSVAVEPVNRAPVAQDVAVTTAEDTPAPITLQATDPDGDPLTYTVLTQPAHGTLGSDDGDASLTYTPAPGFTGSDAFTYQASDGLLPSNTATVSISVVVAGVLFEDAFARPDGATVGNGWTELEAPGGAVGLEGGRLVFQDTSDLASLPQVRHDFPRVSSGQLEETFTFDWTRSGAEGSYRLLLQLGDSALMSDADPSLGVGVDLVWTAIGGVHEMLGYRTAGGTVTPLALVSGAHALRVVADLDAGTFGIWVDGAQVGSAIPLGTAALDTVRWLTDGVNERNFSGRAFDDLVIRQLSTTPPPNRAPVAEDGTATTAVDTPVEVVLVASDPDGDPLTYAVVDPPAHGTITGDDGDERVTYTPAAGFVGDDAFTFEARDAELASNTATVTITVLPSGGALFEDDFARPDGPVVGNGWSELEAPGGAVGLAGGRLVFQDTSDLPNLPQARHAFPPTSSGQLEWTFAFDWTRTGPEGTYRVLLQLGDSSLMSDTDNALGAPGIGVDLVWTAVGGVHEVLGYRTGGSGVTALAPVSGPALLRVVADLDAGTYAVSVDGAEVGSAIPLGSATLDTVRLLTDAVNERNFAGRAFDDLVIRTLP